MSDDAIRELIELYTKESGVRILEREIADVCRKTARQIAEGRCKSRPGAVESGSAGLRVPFRTAPDHLWELP